MKRILVVEPYFGGSHKQFIRGLQKNIEAEFLLITLPARKWKMRMQLSAPWFANRVGKIKNRYFDTVLCSTFVDVAVLRALLTQIDNWNSRCDFCTYFHENQFAYPVRSENRASHLFGTINFTTALASDRLAFNSYFNWQTFFESSSRLVKRAADIDLQHQLEQVEDKASILYPGIDFAHFNDRDRRRNKIPTICWNHRWEHDKNPEEFFHSLGELEDMGYNFRLVILGQSFRSNPSVFARAAQRFHNKIEHIGFAETREEYISHLENSDIVVSTAIHEFFGISIIEAIRAGCTPLLPNRLSYPELYPQKYLYKEGELTLQLKKLLERFHDKRIMNDEAIDTERFSWSRLSGAYQTWLFPPGEKKPG